MYSQHGAYWYVKRNKWTRLSDNLHEALVMHADLVTKPVQPEAAGATDGPSGMVRLIHAAMPGILRNKADSTVEQYTLAQNTLLDVFADAEPEDIQPVHIKRIQRAWGDTPHMCNRRISVLRQVFEYALDEGLVESNPCVGVKRLAEPPRTRYISHEEYRGIWAHGSPDLRVMLDLLYLTGQRIGDVLAITHEDVRPDGVFVLQQKTQKRVLVAMTPDLRAALDAAAALPRKVRGKTILCTLRGSRPYSYKTALDMYKRAAEKAGVEDTIPHDIRAKSLTDAKAQGLDPQALGGHSTMAMTLRYIRQHETTLAQPPSIRQTRKVLDNHG